MLEVRNLSARPDVRDVSLRLYRGDVALVHGEGARTVARVAGGHVPATTGVVRLHGDDLTNRSPQALAALGVTYVGPAAMPYPDLSVVENLVVGAAAAQVSGRVERAEAVLATVPRLGALAGATGASLTDVDALVLVVAVAVARRPRLLVLDGLSARLGGAFAEVRAALRLAAADEVVTLVAEDAPPADAGEYDTTIVVKRGFLR